MEPYDVRFLQEAYEDLEEIVLYIAQDSRSAALKMHDEIVARAGELALLPRRGRPVPEAKMQSAGFRMLPIRPYILFYRVIGDTVFIYRVIHGATNYPLLFGKLRDMRLPESEE
jgi:plasmid stabilization system protein ParE